MLRRPLRLLFGNRAQLEPQARNEVVDRTFVFENQQSNDIALIGDVGVGIKQTVQGIEVRTLDLIQLREIPYVVCLNVAEVCLLATAARDVPAGPALRDGRSIVHGDDVIRLEDQPIHVRQGRRLDEDRCASTHHSIAVMTVQTPSTFSIESLSAFRAVWERVEHDAQIAVHGHDLDQGGSVLPADRSIVIEIQGSRIGAANELGLQAGLRVHEQLRARIDGEIFQQRVEIAPPRFELELHLSPLEPLLQTGDAIVLGLAAVFQGGKVGVVAQRPLNDQFVMDDRRGNRA